MIIILLFFLTTCNAYLTGKCAPQEEVRQIPIGNFAVPTSQQPGPLFSFGQFIVDKHDILAYNHIDYVKGKDKYFLSNELYFLYGLLHQQATLAAVIPIPVVEKDSGITTRGMGDIILHGEYAYFIQDAETFYNYATVLAQIYLPSGIANSFFNPDEVQPELSLGFGSFAFFLGATFFHVDVDWYYFAAAGALLPTKFNHGTKFGNSYLYQAGIGRNLKHMDNKLLMVVLECDGYKSMPDKIHGVTDPDSGSNTIFLGPSLLFTTWQLTLQIGFQFPVLQQLTGAQSKDSFQLAFNIGWVFNHEEF